MIRPLWPGSLRPARIVAGVVLLRSDEAALLQLRDNKPGLNAAGQWGFPGGHCDAGETLEAGARRDFQSMYELSLFWCAYDGRQPVRCFEGQAVEFIPREKAAGLSMPDYVWRVWDIALAALHARATTVSKKKSLRWI